jgi:hypothetical protein
LFWARNTNCPKLVPDDIRQREGHGKLANRLHGGFDALHRKVERIDRIIIAAGGVFDRTTGQAGFGRKLNGLSADGRVVGITVFQICRYGHRRCRDQRATMRQRLFPRHAAVRLADRIRKSRAARGQRFESELRQQFCRPDIPWIRNDKMPGRSCRALNISAVLCCWVM